MFTKNIGTILLKKTGGDLLTSLSWAQEQLEMKNTCTKKNPKFKHDNIKRVVREAGDLKALCSHCFSVNPTITV